METTPITEFNKEKLKNVSDLLHFSNWDKNPVVKHVTFDSFASINNAVYSILSAIETIGYNGTEPDLATCGGLAELARKILPSEEMQFLDELLVDKEKFGEKIPFTSLKDLK